MENNNLISQICNNIPIYLCRNIMCRLCGCTGNNLSYILLKESCYLVKMIKIETRIQIKDNDIYPRTVCRGCIDKVKLIQHFKSHCYKTQKVLHEMYKEKNTHIVNDYNATDNVEKKVIKNETEDDMIVEWLEDEDTNNQLLNEQIEKNNINNKYSVMYDDVNTFQNIHITVQEQNIPSNATIIPHKLLGKVSKPRIKMISQDNLKDTHPSSVNKQNADGTILYRLLNSDDKNKNTNETTDITRTTLTKNVESTLKKNDETEDEDVSPDKRIDRSGRTFITNSHKYVKKVSDKEYSCMICNSKFRYPFQVELHIRRHTGDLPFSCKTCGKNFITGFYLLKHEKTHKTGEYICEVCGKDFRESYSLKDHQRIHTDSSPSFKCKHCGKEYYSKINYDAHKLRHAEKVHICEICGKQFSLLAMLKRHQNRHQNYQFSCQICPKWLKTKEEYNQHIKRHDKCGLYKCTTCSLSFWTKKGLQIHTNLKHKKKIQNSDVNVNVKI